MPHLKSLFRALPLSTPTTNYYDWLLGRPELKSWPDFTLHIDAVTGERRQVHDVLERFEHAATALSASPRDGGLGLVAGKQVVGILSQNCLVCPKKSLSVVTCATYPLCNRQRNIRFSCLLFSRWLCRWRSFLRNPLFKKP